MSDPTAATEPSWYDPWLKDEEAEQGWRAHVSTNCTDGYGFAVVKFAYNWMILMQKEIRDNPADSIGDVAERTESKAAADDITGGITGFQFGCAMSVISQVWKHGDELRRWHNLKTQIKDEGERANETGGVLNPAIMTIGE